MCQTVELVAVGGDGERGEQTQQAIAGRNIFATDVLKYQAGGPVRKGIDQQAGEGH